MRPARLVDNNWEERKKKEKKWDMASKRPCAFFRLRTGKSSFSSPLKQKGWVFKKVRPCAEGSCRWPLWKERTPGGARNMPEGDHTHTHTQKKSANTHPIDSHGDQKYTEAYAHRAQISNAESGASLVKEAPVS
nr:hypothetical protein [Pandoravirus massiliensis]